MPWLVGCLAPGMRFLSFGLLAAASALVPCPALAEEPEEVPPPLRMPALRGPQLGARLGYALPMGTLAGTASALNTRLSALETASVPIGVDVGYRFSPYLYLGGTLAWGAGIAPNSPGPCQQTDVSCFRQDVQLRVESRFYFAPYARTRPGGWLAVGLGWEVASFWQSVGGSTTTATLTGPILPDLQLGFDVQRGPLGIGPYLGVAFAEFVTHGVDPAATPASTWIDDRAVHTWITLGVHGSYGLW